MAKVAGSMWVDGTHWIHYDANPYTDHEDWPHADAVIVGHGDVTHVDTSHADSGSDFTSLGHYDGSWHSDNSALNSTPGPAWLQQGLTPGVSGSHADSHYDYTVTSGGHGDATVGHTDTSSPHTDSHVDITIPHTDSHDDQPTAV